MQLQKNVSLQPYNTFGIEARAAAFAKVSSVEELRAVLRENRGQRPIFILGGGSNLLLTQDVPLLVIKNDIKGIKIIEESATSTLVAVGGGENWHEFVLWALRQNLGGVENLSLIPGTVGAAPIQNIGAYGVELQDVFVKLEVVELATGTLKTFYKEDCQFGYRNSIFKNEYKGQFCITKVFLELTKEHEINTSYGAIQHMLEERGITDPTIQDISDVVISIRQSKLPDPAELGNSGSFFKNPEIERKQLEQLQKKFPSIVHYDLPDGCVKVPAGWLIEQCGWKGKRIGNTGAHKNQALVLVNYGGASGQEIWHLALKIMQSVKDKFGIQLTPEVNVL